ncbi:MAG: SDR family oxidoreductase [Gammaproteobacteria bacterium]|nr:SDR family oxidoreductase [Gammaproteobacteria bacterium]
MSEQYLFDLSGKVAVVTGGSSGIGLALGKALASAGAKVVLLARRENQLQEAVTEINNAAYVVADLAQRETIPDIATQVTNHFGSPSILVNCAGVNLREPYQDISLDSWDQTINLNLSVPFFLAREFLPAMQMQSWGKIINIASLQSNRAFANSIPYGASKAGIVQLTRAMAEAWSKDGISCNAIAPGFFPTNLTTPVFDNPEREQWAAQQTAIGRNGKLRDLDGVAVFLASPASDYITGQTIYVDGGFTAK